MSAFSSTRVNAASAAPSWSMTPAQRVAASVARQQQQLQIPKQNPLPAAQPAGRADRSGSLSEVGSLDLSDHPHRVAGYHVEGLHAYIWSTQPVPVPGVHTRDAADISSENVRLSIFDNRCTLFCYERGVEFETVWAKDILHVTVRGGTVSLVPTPCSAQSIDDHGEFVVRKLLSGVVMKRPVEKPRVRTWAAMRLVFDADATAQEVGTALEALKIRHMQTIPKRLSAENGELEKAMVLQHKARSLLASLGIRPEGVLSLASIGAAGPSQSYLDEVEEVVDSDDDEQQDLEEDDMLAECEPFVPFGPVVHSLLTRLESKPQPVQPNLNQPNYSPHSHERRESPVYRTAQFASTYSPLPLVLSAPPPKLQLQSLSQPSATTISATRSIAADQTVINVDEVEEIFPSPREDFAAAEAAVATRVPAARAPEVVEAVAASRPLPPPAPPLDKRRAISPSSGEESLSEVSADDGATNVRQTSRRSSTARRFGRRQQAVPVVDEALMGIRSEPAPKPMEPSRDAAALVSESSLARQDSATRSGTTPTKQDGNQRTCRWCHKPAPPHHDAKCSYREMRCKKCGERSLLRDLKAHVCKAN